MSKIRGGVGRSLATILDALRGQLDLNEIRDQEGIAAVYDLSSIAEAELYCQDTRGFDSGALAASGSSTQTITGLPAIFTVLGIFIGTDVAARVAQVAVKMSTVGVATATRDWPLALWLAGDASVPTPGGWQIGDGAMSALLIPPVERTWWAQGPVQTNRANLTGRQGGAAISVEVDATAFGGGTVTVSGHIVTGFFRRGRDVLAIRPF